MASDQYYQRDDAYYDDEERRRRRRSSSSSRRSSDATRRSSDRRSSSETRRSSTRRPTDERGRSSSDVRRSSSSSRRRSSSDSRRLASDQRRSASDPRRSATDARRRKSAAAARTSAKGKTRKASAAKKQTSLLSGVGQGLDRMGLREPNGRPSTGLLIAGGVLALVLVLGLHHFLRLGISVNGTRHTVWRGTTIEKLLDKGFADPKPGNLLAVDGALLEEGKGDRCAATMDGETAKLDTKVKRGASILINDGSDVTEDSTVTEEAIPYGTANASTDFDYYWSGAIHLLSDGENGVETVTTGKVSGKKVTEVVKPAIPKGYSIYSVHTTDKVCALTFDDGPWPETTKQILDILEKNGAKATFFTIGNQISEHPEDVKRAAQMGCEVCTHSWDHAAGNGQGVNLTYMSSSEQVEEIQKGYAAIKEVLGTEPVHIIRSPGGNFYGSIVDTLWNYVDAEIGWDLDTEDWRLPGSDAIYETIMQVEPGQVVLMHDGGGDRSETVEALDRALPELVQQGYRFLTMSELLEYGITGEVASTEDSESSESGSTVTQVG